MTGLFLPQRILDAVIAHAEREAPAEVCGVVSGQDRIAREIHSGCSAACGMSRLPSVECGGLSAVGQVRAAGLEVLALYRGRPNGPAHPEAGDLQLGLTPDLVYLIVSLIDPWKPVFRGFRIHGHRIVEVPVTVFNDQDYDPAQDYVI